MARLVPVTINSTGRYWYRKIPVQYRRIMAVEYWNQSSSNSNSRFYYGNIPDADGGMRFRNGDSSGTTH